MFLIKNRRIEKLHMCLEDARWGIGGLGDAESLSEPDGGGWEFGLGILEAF